MVYMQATSLVCRDLEPTLLKHCYKPAVMVLVICVKQIGWAKGSTFIGVMFIREVHSS